MSEPKDVPHTRRSLLPMSWLMCVGPAHRVAKPTRRVVLKGAAAAAVAFTSGVGPAAMPSPFIPPPTPGTFPGCMLIRDCYGRHLWQFATDDDMDKDGAWLRKARKAD